MLLDEIIGLLGSEQNSLTDALLKTKILLHQIGKRELVGWVNNELNGYPNEIDVPPYRRVPSMVLADFVGMTLRASGHPIPIMHLSDEQRESLEQMVLGQSLTVLADLIADSNPIMRPLPMELNPALGASLARGLRINRAWCQTSAQDVRGIIAQVRSRLLDFLLELKDTVGPATTESELREKSTSLDAQSMFNSAIFGSNTTILIGHQSSITATQTINGSELAEGVRKLVDQLEKALPSSGLPDVVQSGSQPVLAELRVASAAPTPDVSRLRRGLESLKHVMEHAAGHLVATGALTTIATLLQSSPVH